MYLVCVDFSKNNLLTEQLNVRSFYDLQVLNSSLLDIQLSNFANSNIAAAYITENNKTVDCSLFDAKNISINDFNRQLYKINSEENIIIFRNDIYFEVEVSEYEQSITKDDFFAFSDENDVCYCIITSVKNLRTIFNKNITFKELFLKNKSFINVQLTAGGYTKYLSTVKKYKELLFDILNGKTLFKPPHVAEGVYTNQSIPSGDFSIVPPVYFGNSVQIERGTIVGPNVIIYNNSLVSCNTSIKNSVLFDSVFISSGCYIDGAVCCENSSVKRNSAVFCDSVIGENALIGEDTVVENGSLIIKDVKYDNFVKSPFTNNATNTFGFQFQGLSPDKAAFLGSAIATVFQKPKVIVANDGSPNSLAIKLAMLSGLIASGAECFDMGNTYKSQVFFGLAFCECIYSIFITGKNDGTNIEIFNIKNELLSKSDCSNLFDFCNKKEIVYVEKKECKKIRQIRGLKKMYIQQISSPFYRKIRFFPIVKCKNETINKTLKSVFDRVVECNESSEKIFININDSGSKINFVYKNREYNDRDLKKLVRYFYRKNENCPLFQNIYYKKLWDKDSVFLLFSVFYILNTSDKDITELIEELPDFFIRSKNFKCALKTGEIARKISDFDNCFVKNGNYNIPLKNGIIKVKRSNLSDEVKVACVSDKMSISDELCDFFGHLLT